MDLSKTISTLENRFTSANIDIRELQEAILTLDLKVNHLSLSLKRKFSTKNCTSKKGIESVCTIVRGPFSDSNNPSLAMDDEPTICNIPITDLTIQECRSAVERTGSKIENKDLYHFVGSPETPVSGLNDEDLNVDVGNNSEVRHTTKSFKITEISSAETQRLNVSSQSEEQNRGEKKSTASNTSPEEKREPLRLNEFGFRSRMTKEKEDNRLKYMTTRRGNKSMPKVSHQTNLPQASAEKSVLPPKGKKPIENRLYRDQGQIGLMKGRRQFKRADAQWCAQQDAREYVGLMKEGEADVVVDHNFESRGRMECLLLTNVDENHPLKYMVLKKQGWKYAYPSGNCHELETENRLKAAKSGNSNTSFRNQDGWDDDVDDMITITKKGELIESKKSRSNKQFSVEEKNKRNARLSNLVNGNLPRNKTV